MTKAVCRKDSVGGLKYISENTNVVGLLWEEVENSCQQATVKNGWSGAEQSLGPRLGRTQPVWTSTRVVAPVKAPACMGI